VVKGRYYVIREGRRRSSRQVATRGDREPILLGEGEGGEERKKGRRKGRRTGRTGRTGRTRGGWPTRWEGRW